MAVIKDKLVIEVELGVVKAVKSTIPKSYFDVLIVDYDEMKDENNEVEKRKEYFDFRQKNKLEKSKMGFPMKKLKDLI